MRDTGLIGVADDPALELLNSTAVPVQEVVELIQDGRSYVEWLVCAGLLDAADKAEVHERFSEAELDAVAAEAGALREWLRPVIATWATSPAEDAVLPAAVRLRLDDILRQDSGYFRLPTGHERGDLVRVRAWHQPRQLLVPVAEAVARLLVSGDPSLVRQCEGPTCTLWFHDRTKSHRRRWCSMAVCGNRAKARAHRERAR